MLYKSDKIVSVAAVEFLNESEVSIRSLATDEVDKNRGYARHMMQLLERWIKQQGKEVIKIHAADTAEIFYRKLGYNDMEFNDVSISLPSHRRDPCQISSQCTPPPPQHIYVVVLILHVPLGGFWEVSGRFLGGCVGRFLGGCIRRQT